MTTSIHGGMKRLGPLVAAAMVVAACAAGTTPDSAPTDPPPAAVATPTPAQADTPAPPIDSPPAGQPTGRPAQPPATDEPQPIASPAPELPADLWRTAELIDVRSGETLVINELYGRLVVVQPMAIWCTTCRSQQNEAREALTQLPTEDIVYISLDVDPNETEADLARYADQREWPWHFVVASREVSRSLAEVFGDQVLSPPSAPKVYVSPDGQAEVSFGLRPASQLQAELAALLP